MASVDRERADPQKFRIRWRPAVRELGGGPGFACVCSHGKLGDLERESPSHFNLLLCSCFPFNKSIVPKPGNIEPLSVNGI